MLRAVEKASKALALRTTSHMPRRRTSSLPSGISGDAAASLNPSPGLQSPSHQPSAAFASQAVPTTTASAAAAWKPPRKQEVQLNSDAIDDPRGGPLTLDALHLNVLAKTDHFLVLNKNADVRLDGDFNVTIEKAMHRDYPDIDKFRWIHQLDFATSGVMCVGLTKESTAAASGLFAKKCAEKEYLALVHGTMPFVPPRGAKCCTFSRVADFIYDKDHPKVIHQHQHKFTKQFKGPRTGPSIFAMDQGLLRRKLAAGGTDPTPAEADFLRKAWNDLSDDIQKTYFDRAAADKLRFDAQVKSMALDPLPQVRYDIPLLQPQGITGCSTETSAGLRSCQRLRSFSDASHSAMSKRSRLNSDDPYAPTEPMGYIFDDPIAASTTNSFQMEISPTGKMSTTLAFVLGHGTFEGNPVTKLLLRPLSGRRHQLRLHLSHHGYPIVGDVTYGSEEDPAPRMMLHAWKLNLRFPPDQQRVYGSTMYKSPDPFASMVKSPPPMLTTIHLKAVHRGDKPISSTKKAAAT
ncbi:hypothetical protein H310_04563 [Aphanomyces invadans]|uniref:Pseudouridine synthase RsuA/RluA-like domain-containing protein n=1 Tax=Aphanomyces invadans TaxID=157072 RepID=A0A024UDC9_9STRA|nr:hypothetical protein H310_04563 [Aphanomyces invadans]ETW04225.1 hypothetical protein H310_04563 [Aphanomyces invadans]|eukprot:XP_008867181.1 hypothetical protein H310_04563 [Aphanomyces invadans]